MQGGAVRFAVEQADVHLQVILELHAHLVFTFGQQLSDFRESGKVVRDAGVVTSCDEEVKVSDGFTPAPE